MKSIFFLAALAAAAPLANHRRQVQSLTVTDYVTVTTTSYTTTWVSSSTADGFFESYPTGEADLSNAPADVPAAASPSSTTTSSTPPPPTSTPPPPPPPVQPAAAPPPAPPAAAPPAPAYVPPTTTPASPPTGTGPAAGDHTGDITYYDVSVGLGSCGWQGTNQQNLVALSSADMNNGANPNNNPNCHKTINIYYNGGVHQATVYDTCPTCAEGSIDLTNALFTQVAPSGDGRVHGVTWSFA